MYLFIYSRGLVSLVPSGLPGGKDPPGVVREMVTGRGVNCAWRFRDVLKQPAWHKLHKIKKHVFSSGKQTTKTRKKEEKNPKKRRRQNLTNHSTRASNKHNSWFYVAQNKQLAVIGNKTKTKTTKKWNKNARTEEKKIRKSEKTGQEATKRENILKDNTPSLS